MQRSSKRTIRLVFLGAVIATTASLSYLLWKTERQNRLDTSLAVAVRRNDLTAVNRLLQLGADPNAKDDFFSDHRPIQRRLYDLILRQSPIHLSSAIPILMASMQPMFRGGAPPVPLRDPVVNLAIFKTLIEHGADINVRCNQLPTPPSNTDPLLYAVVFHLPKQVHLLLEHGVDLRCRKGDVTWIVQRAVEEGDPAILTDLIDHGAIQQSPYKPAPLEYLLERAIYARQVECMKVILRMHPNVNLVYTVSVPGKGRYSYSLLTIAKAQLSSIPPRKESKQIVQLLEAAGAKT